MFNLYLLYYILFKAPKSEPAGEAAPPVSDVKDASAAEDLRDKIPTHPEILSRSSGRVSWRSI